MNEIELKKGLLMIERENIELKHKYKMMELEMEDSNSKKKHERDLEYTRIKSAEIRKQLERKRVYEEERAR